MEIILLNQDKIIIFESIFKNLKNIIKECCIEFNENGIYIQGMDTTHALLFELNIVSEWFDCYTIKTPNTFGIHCETFFKIINCLKTTKKIELKRECEDSEILEISFVGEKNQIEKHFELTEIQIEINKMDIPEMEYQVDIQMKTNDLANIIKELTIFNENININFNQNNLEFKTDGNLGKAKMSLDENNIELYAIEEDLSYSLQFSAEYFNNICTFNKLNDSINIHSSRETPLKIQYNLDDNISNIKCEIIDSDEENEENNEIINPKSFCTFYIASIMV